MQEQRQRAPNASPNWIFSSVPCAPPPYLASPPPYLASSPLSVALPPASSLLPVVGLALLAARLADPSPSSPLHVLYRRRSSLPPAPYLHRRAFRSVFSTPSSALQATLSSMAAAHLAPPASSSFAPSHPVLPPALSLPPVVPVALPAHRLPVVHSIDPPYDVRTAPSPAKRPLSADQEPEISLLARPNRQNAFCIPHAPKNRIDRSHPLPSTPDKRIPESQPPPEPFHRKPSGRDIGESSPSWCGKATCAPEPPCLSKAGASNQACEGR